MPRGFSFVCSMRLPPRVVRLPPPKANCYDMLAATFSTPACGPRSASYQSAMARPYLPQTTASDLCLRVSQLVAKSDRYLGRDSFEARMLLRECEKLRQADKFDGAIASIYLAEAFGDAEQVRRHATQARNAYRRNWDEAEFQMAQSLVGLGYFSEAQAIFRQVGNPGLGQLSNRANLGMVSGSMKQLHGFLAQARSMNLELDEDAIAPALAAYAVYQQTSTTDSQAGDLLDLAGVVLRAHRLFAVNGSPKVSAIDHPELSTVIMELTVRAPVEEVGTMNLELAELVALRLDAVPAGVVVMFSGAS